ncbi:MAG: ABC transporter permease [Phaeodactylibacter sp.]|nr:ABC transporter permease [Phaeodactylibacter sp.]MCB9297680.1 ABC transporter permease [Lewinellaceae bacterium]
MRHLAAALQWDLIRQFRYNIIYAAGLVTLIYMLILLNLPEGPYQEKILIFLIFNDPAALGMLFIGALVLFERSENTLEALRVTPLAPEHYILSKTLTLTLVAVLSALPMAFAGYGWRFHYLYFAAGIGLTASLYTLLGLAAVASCRNFNQYLLRMAGILVPTALPFLNFFEITDTLWWYLLPSQGGLLLLEAAFLPAEGWQIIYGFLYLLLWNAGAFWLAKRNLRKEAS